jgi:hypothetical protein
MAESNRTKRVLAEATKYIGEEAATALLAKLRSVEDKYAETSTSILEQALDDARTILSEPLAEGCSKVDSDKAARVIGHYFLDGITCDSLGSAAAVSMLRQESIAEFVAHACQHHEDAKMMQMRHMLQDVFAPIMEKVEREAVTNAAEENGVGN